MNIIVHCTSKIYPGLGTLPLPRVRLSSGILTPCNALQESVMSMHQEEEEQEEELPLLEEQEQAAGGGAGVFGEAAAAALRGQAA